MSLRCRESPGRDRSSRSRRWRSPGVAAVLATAAALLVPLACVSDDAAGDAGSETTETARTDARAGNGSDASGHSHGESGGHTHGSGSHTHASADTLAAGVELDVLPGERGTASATVLAVGDSLRVLISVEGATGGSLFPAELAAGGCDDSGPTLVSLAPVATGTAGSGSSQTTIPASRVDGHHHAALRLLSEEESYAACAPLHLSAGSHQEG